MRPIIVMCDYYWGVYSAWIPIYIGLFRIHYKHTYYSSRDNKKFFNTKKLAKFLSISYGA